MNYTFKQIEDNLIRYCYDLLWLKFIYETTVARIRAQEQNTQKGSSVQ